MITPRTYLAFAAVVFCLGAQDARTQTASRPTKDPSCGLCHGKEAALHLSGVHADAGVGCVTCHGGDSSLATRAACIDNPQFKGVPRGKAAVDLCGNCHSDPDAMFRYGLPTGQLAYYQRSPHGKAVLDRGDKNAPVCIDCHGAHDIRSKTDPLSPIYRARVPVTCARCHADAERMKPYKLPSDVFEKYSKSVHGKGLLSGKQLRLPNCADCHSAHGARPAGVTEVADVCGQCHVAARENFKRSPHFTAAQAGKMQECTSCHRYHDIDAVPDTVTEGWKPLACAQCHQPDSKTDQGSITAQAMTDLMGSLKTRVADTTTKIENARSNGIVVRAEETYINDARHALVMAGPVGHATSIDDFKVLVGKADGVVAKVDEALNVKLRNIRDRRILGCVVFALIALLAATVRVHVRRRGRAAAPTGAGAEGRS